MWHDCRLSVLSDITSPTNESFVMLILIEFPQPSPPTLGFHECDIVHTAWAKAARNGEFHCIFEIVSIHADFSASIGTSLLPFAILPQQQPLQMTTFADIKISPLYLQLEVFTRFNNSKDQCFGDCHYSENNCGDQSNHRTTPRIMFCRKIQTDHHSREANNLCPYHT